MQKKAAKRIKSDKKGIFMVQFLKSVIGGAMVETGESLKQMADLKVIDK